MPPASIHLDINVLISVSKRFIKDRNTKSILLEVVLDEVPGIVLCFKQGCLKYIGPVENSTSIATEPVASIPVNAITEDLLEDAIESASEDEVEDDLTPSDGWSNGEVFVDSRLCSDSYQQTRSKLDVDNHRHASPLEYFLFFLPCEQFHCIIGNTNAHARSVDRSWTDINYNEYMMWLALLTVMTVIRHSDRKAYWKQGSSYFMMNIDFSKYMSLKSSVGAANNLRDNKISYHDIVSTKRWEMRFFGFLLGICEANAYSSYRVFSTDGGITHSAFKDALAWIFLKHCEALNFGPVSVPNPQDPRVLRSDSNHQLLTMKRTNGAKRVRLAYLLVFRCKRYKN